MYLNCMAMSNACLLIDPLAKQCITIMFFIDTEESVAFLSKPCKLACTHAQNELERLCKNLRDGSVKCKDLQKLRDQNENIRNLLKAGMNEKKFTESMNLLLKRIVEHEQFQRQQRILGQLCQNVMDIQVKGN